MIASVDMEALDLTSREESGTRGWLQNLDIFSYTHKGSLSRA